MNHHHRLSRYRLTPGLPALIKCCRAPRIYIPSSNVMYSLSASHELDTDRQSLSDEVDVLVSETDKWNPVSRLNMGP